MSNSSTRPLAVVTGASSGIGKEIAKQLLERGYDLIAASGASDLNDIVSAGQAQGGNVETIATDLATHDGVHALREKVNAAGRPVDVLVLNAGVGRGGSFLDESSLEEELKMIQLNVVSTVHLAKHLLPPMAARGSGRVLITASIAAVTPTPFETIYGATKAFVRSFAGSLHAELKDKGITVTALMPGPTETNFFHRAGMDDTKIGASKKDDPADVARQGLDALMAGKEHVIAGSLKTKLQGELMENVLPETLKGSMHVKQAAPGSAQK